MKRIKKIAAAAVFAAVIFSVFAISVNANKSDAFLNEFYELSGKDSATSDEILSDVGVDALLSELLSAISGSSGSALSFFLLILGVVLLSSLAELPSELATSSFKSASRVAVSAVSAFLIFSRLYSLVSSVSESLSSLSSFFSSLIPIITGISAAGGAVGSAGVQAVNMNITLSVISKLSAELLLPLVTMMFALALISAIGPEAKSISAFVRSIFLWLVGIASVLVLAAAGMQAFFAGSSDSAALRAAKYALSGTVPIVGTTVSGALSALWSSASYAASAVGVGSVVMIIGSAASPLVLMLLYRLSLSLSISLSSMFSSPALELLSGFRAALDTLIALYTLSVLTYIIEIGIFTKCVVMSLG